MASEPALRAVDPAEPAMHPSLRCVLLIASAALAPGAAASDFHLYAGGSFISGEAAQAAADGWNLGFGGVSSRDRDLALRWDFAIDEHDMRPSTITNVLADDGDITTAFLRLGPEWSFGGGYDERFYINAMVGYYWTTASISMEVLVPGIYCDPFWGWCWTTLVPGEQILDQRHANDWGYSASIGYEWGGPEAAWFIELQYHQARQGESYAFAPLVVGIRW